MPLPTAGAILLAAQLGIQVAEAQASALLNLTTTITDITGATVSLTAQTSSAIYIAVGVFDAVSIGTTATTGVGILNLDGADSSSGQAIFSQSNTATGLRSTVSQVWSGTLTAGSHTWKLRGQRSGGADSMIRFNNFHTKLVVAVFG